MTPEIVTLPPMTCYRFHVLSATPETDAWAKLSEWAGHRGLLAGRSRVFGFNNPDPSSGSPNYGYEFWLLPDPTISADLGGPEVVSFEGGRYAMARFTEADPSQLPAAWRRLAEWLEQTSYEHGSHQWFEEITLAGMPVLLYLPIK